MIRRQRLRRLVAPTTGLLKAGLLTVGGLTILGAGFLVSFKAFLLPIFATGGKSLRETVSSVVQRSDVEVAMHLIGGVALIVGTLATVLGARAALRHIVETLNPSLKSGMVDVYRRRLILAQGPRIVAIGGGTGLSTLLRGLKHHSSNITAVVTVTDDGGSSGRLIRDKGIIPPGDIRNCLVALADAEKAMTDLFQHRFKEDSGSLSGHSMGNLLIAALADQAQGDFERAIELASEVLAIRGRVVPSTLDHVQLRAELNNGEEVIGETAIVAAGQHIRKIHLNPADVRATQEAVDAILAADLVCIGPGSVFTSIIPNLIVPGIAKALAETEALRVFVCNVMTQPGESDDFTAQSHVTAVLTHTEKKVFDAVLVNNAIPSEEAQARYREVGQHLVVNDADRIRSHGLRVIAGDFLSSTDVVRHDPMKVAARLISLLESS